MFHYIIYYKDIEDLWIMESEVEFLGNENDTCFGAKINIYRLIWIGPFGLFKLRYGRG